MDGEIPGNYYVAHCAHQEQGVDGAGVVVGHGSGDCVAGGLMRLRALEFVDEDNQGGVISGLPAGLRDSAAVVGDEAESFCGGFVGIGVQIADAIAVIAAGEGFEVSVVSGVGGTHEIMVDD